MFREDVAAALPRLRVFVRSLASDRHLADDLVQDTRASALRARHQFTPGTNLEAWLSTIPRDRLRTVARRERRHVETAGGEASEARGRRRPRPRWSRCWRSAKPSAGSTQGSARCWWACRA